ncbi:MAG: HEAT repeat domain-containing protein [Planctomycetes bacterium]|nr:HEAT repeat domain-containing protein [Planctomycetota bacterium]
MKRTTILALAPIPVACAALVALLACRGEEKGAPLSFGETPAADDSAAPGHGGRAPGRAAPLARSEVEETVQTFVAENSAAKDAEIAPERGAAVMGSFLAGSDQPEEVLALSRAAGADPEFAGLLAAEAEILRASGDPALRARGIQILAAMGVLDAEGWRAALAAEADPAARALVVANPPLSGATDGEALVAAVLDRAVADPSPEVRRSALLALPDGLSNEARGMLLSILAQDEDAAVRRSVAQYFRESRSTGPEATQALYAASQRANEDPEVRRAAVMALFEIETRTPGSLAAAGGNEENLRKVLTSISTDQG